LRESFGSLDIEVAPRWRRPVYFLTGIGASCSSSGSDLALNKAVRGRFRHVIPPVLVREIRRAPGVLGAHASEVYTAARRDLYLVGTREVAAAGTTPGEIMRPRRRAAAYAGWSTCFRREGRSYGKGHAGHHRAPVRQDREFSYAAGD